ncbi:MAG TPA: hypothetical protein PK358_13820 [Spirochaetota bacterium]|nr:hypothetical protein [Spirochaetota bacterium]HPJ35911.1 hypothetical protein [Spirochaetota bacterium]
MSYLFINIETGEQLSCDELVWVEAFEAAKADGWVPDGTLYDAPFIIDEELDFIDDDNWRLWTIYSEISKIDHWDGSYTKKRNQVVTYEDAYYMAMSLKCAGVDEKLCEFVGKGSFRICSE